MYKNKIVTLYQGAATWVGRRAPTRSTPGVRRSVSRRSPVWTSSTADSTRSPRPTCRPVTSPSPAGRSTHVQTGSPTARHGQSGSSHYLHMGGDRYRLLFLGSHCWVIVFWETDCKTLSVREQSWFTHGWDRYQWQFSELHSLGNVYGICLWMFYWWMSIWMVNLLRFWSVKCPANLLFWYTQEKG